MKPTVGIVLAMALGAVAVTAEARKDCTELKSEIEAKFQAKGVQNYSLDIVAPGDTGNATVVGSCNGGEDRIVYARTGAAAAASSTVDKRPEQASVASEKAAPAKAAPPPAIGNY